MRVCVVRSGGEACLHACNSLGGGDERTGRELRELCGATGLGLREHCQTRA